MKGQWLGKFTEVNSSGINITGSAIINIDEMPTHYQGVATLMQDDQRFPDIYVYFTTEDKNKIFIIKQPGALPINPENGMPVGTPDDWEKVKQRYGTLNFSNQKDVEGIWDEDKLILKWVSQSGAKGQCEFAKSRASEPSEYKPTLNVNNWNEYKCHVNKLEVRRFIFRGQKNNTQRLRTAFHRTGRSDLNKYEIEDIQTLHRHLSARTRHLINLENPLENGAFYNLVQHHGYPTPLLDWTYSPYVAVFFAYRGINNSDAINAKETEKVRIFIFNQKQWQFDFNHKRVIRYPYPYFAILEALAIDNERMIPQQAVSTVTNIDDIENYMKRQESEKNTEYLTVIDLPLKERANVMRELSYMGITAGSLFPGLDGACEELKERFFEI